MDGHVPASIAAFPLPSTWASPTTIPPQTVPAKVRLTLPTFHMKTSCHLFNQMSTFRTMFPSLFLPNGLHLLSVFVFSAKAIGMLPCSTVSTGPSFACTYSNVAMYVLWWYEGAAFTIAAVERIGVRDFEFEQVVLLHEGCTKLPRHKIEGKYALAAMWLLLIFYRPLKQFWGH